MRDVFVIDNSIFDDALAPGGRSEFKESSKEFLNELFKLKLDGITLAYIPEEAYEKFTSYFESIGKTQTISLISNIVEIGKLSKKSQKVYDSLLDLAYKLTLTPCKVSVVTNNQKIYRKLLESDKIFYVLNSNEALETMRSSNFLKCDTP